jgi:hypothetical protein
LAFKWQYPARVGEAVSDRHHYLWMADQDAHECSVQWGDCSAGEINTSQRSTETDIY